MGRWRLSDPRRYLFQRLRSQAQYPAGSPPGCEFEEGTATLAGPEIAKPNGSSRPQPPLEFCDYAATTFTMNFCGDYESQIEDDRRSRYENSLKSSMTPLQQASFANLLAARNSYIEVHILEVDQGGTIRGLRTMGSQSILKDLFHVDMVHFERHMWPSLSGGQIARSDTLLQREYEAQLQQLRTHTQDMIDGGGVTAANLSRVETAWTAYREAWVAFARLRYPTAVAGIRAKITLDRYRLLKTIS
jgi:hypothetical protein